MTKRIPIHAEAIEHQDSLPSVRLFEMSTNAVGAAAELVVAVNLMQRGYKVFRALSAQCPCDLIAMNDQYELLRIEVKSVRDGSTYYPATNGDEKYDLLALVVGLSSVFLFTPEEYRAKRNSLGQPWARK